MNANSRNYYKICRKTAGLTQIDAAALVNISTRQFIAYENGEVRTPDEVVDKMAELYHAPLLAWWHLKEYNCLAKKYLPDIQLPTTHGDMAFRAIIAQDELSPAVHTIKQIMSDGQIDDDERDDFDASITQIKQVTTKLMSVTAYASQQEADNARKAT